MRWIFLTAFFFLMIADVSGISTDLSANESYEQKQTVIGEIFGNILANIKGEQIEFLKGHVIIPEEYDIKRLGERYFIWFIAPESEGNYTLRIKDIETTENGARKKLNYEINFSVSGNKSKYSLKPGFIDARSEFEIKAILNDDMERIISINYPYLHETALKPGENILKFPVDGVVGTQLIKIMIGRYTLPAYIIGTGEEIIPYNYDIEVEPRVIKKIIRIYERPVYFILVRNVKNESIKINLDYNKSIFDISDKEQFELKSGESRNISLNLKELNGPVNEKIYLNYGKDRLVIPVDIAFIAENEERQDGRNESNLYCEEIPGKVCDAGSKCSGEEINALNGLCCKGVCEERKSGKSWYSLILFILVIAGAIYLYMRYKKGNNEDPLKKSIAKAERKML